MLYNSNFFVFREEIARQRNVARQRKLQEEGKTDQARSDLARLAVIRKQREEAAKKREEQKKGMLITAKEDFLFLSCWINSKTFDMYSN